MNMKEKRVKKEKAKEESKPPIVLYKNIFNIKSEKNELEHFTNILKLRYSKSKLNSVGKARAQIMDKIHSAVYKTLSKKYSIREGEYQGIIVENLLYNKNCHLVSVFKDNMIYDFIMEEFLKRLYKFSECLERIPKFATYYKNYLKFFCNPIFRDFEINDIIQTHGENRAELYYNRNYGKKEKNSDKNLDERMRNIFNTTIKENIDRNSLTQTTIRYNIQDDRFQNNISINDIDMFKPHSDKNKNESTHFNINETQNDANKSGFITVRSREESICNILNNLETKPNEAKYMPKPVTRLIKESKIYGINNVNNGYNKDINPISKPDSSNTKVNNFIDNMMNKDLTNRGPKERVVSPTFNSNNGNVNTFNKAKSKSNTQRNVKSIDEEGNNIKQNNEEETVKHSNYNAKSIINNPNNNAINVNKSPTNRNTLSRLNEFKNLKLNKIGVNVAGINSKNSNFASGSNNLSNNNAHSNNSNSNHNKHAGSTDFAVGTTMGRTNNYNTSGSNINTNSNLNTPSINPGPPSKLSGKLQYQSVNDLKELAASHMRKTSTDINNLFSTNNLLNSITSRGNAPTTNKNINSNMNSNLNTNSNKKTYNTVLNTAALNNNNNTPINSNINIINPSNMNDVMKITLSVYMDKSSRNRPHSNISQASTVNNQMRTSLNTLNIIDRKTTIINKIDNINNFNININNQFNIPVTESINPHTIINKIGLNNFNSTTGNLIVSNNLAKNIKEMKNVNSNLKTMLEKSKTLSRNKNPSLYKLPSNHIKSSHVEEDKKDTLRESKQQPETKIYSSYTHIGN